MEILKGLAESMQQAVEALDAEGFYRLSSLFQGLKSEAREKIQEMTSESVKEIIEKLGKGTELTKEEMDLVKLWIIGDAESYSKMENNYEDWLAEFKRLAAVFGEYASGPDEIQALFRAQGILEDARRVARDLGGYLETKERISRFEEVTANPTRADTELIARILSMKLHSPES